jgi:hypothetical protein
LNAIIELNELSARRPLDREASMNFGLIGTVLATSTIFFLKRASSPKSKDLTAFWKSVAEVHPKSGSIS